MDLRRQGYVELREAGTEKEMWQAQGGLNVLESLCDFPNLVDHLIKEKQEEEKLSNGDGN